jgi:hypothetical protein
VPDLRLPGYRQPLAGHNGAGIELTVLVAHYRKALAAATVLNAAISAVEAVAGFEAHSLSLVMTPSTTCPMRWR